MISPEHKKLLEQLSSTPYGMALMAFLNEEIGMIDTVRGTKDRTKEEDIGRELALDLIDKLFSFMKAPNPQAPRNKTHYT